MNLRNESPFKAAWLEGKIRPSRTSATFVVKGTFDLKPGGPVPVSVHPLEFSGDAFADGDLKKAQIYSSDLVPFKPKADVLVSACAYAPRKGTADVLRVSVQVGRVNKMLAVIGDRVWRSGFLGNTMGPIKAFQRMELTWDRSFGGAGFAKNAVGRGYGEEAGPDGKPVVRLPNVEDPARLISSPSDKPEPAGFGPIPMSSPVRMAKVGTYKAKWFKERFPWFPEDFDWAFFNAAPLDQQAAYFRGDEALKFENLHRDHAVLECRLPGIRVRCFYAKVVMAPEDIVEVPMNLDTVSADLEADKLVLVWRGVHDLDTPQLGKFDAMYVVTEPLAESPKPAYDYQAALRASLRSAAKPPPPAPKAPALPVAAAAAPGAPLQSAPASEEGPPVVPPVPPVRIPKGPGREELAGRASRKESFAGQDLSEADLSGLDLRGLDFTGAILSDASFRKSSLTGAKLAGAILHQADLTKAELDGADLTKADLTAARLKGARLTGAILDGTDFTEAFLQDVDFSGAKGGLTLFSQSKLRGAIFRKASLPGADFTESMMSDADFSDADMPGAAFEGAYANPLIAERANFTAVKAAGAVFRVSRFKGLIAKKSIWQEARLYQADFSEADLSQAEFAKADLTGARFDLAVVRSAKLIQAVIREASALRADFFDVNLQKADLSGADFSEATLFKADMIDTRTDGTVFDRANLKRTLLTIR